MTNENYYYTVNGSAAQGPQPLKSLHIMRESGTLSGAVMVAREGDQEWVPIEATMRDNTNKTNVIHQQPVTNHHVEAMTKTQGYLLLLLFGIGLLFSGYTFFEGRKATGAALSIQTDIAKSIASVISIQNDATKALNSANTLQTENSNMLSVIKTSVAPVSAWEYCTISFTAEGESRTGSGALKFSTAEYNAAVVAKLGAAGWELATCYLEMETAFPNFGKDEYVTGLQSNVRPQKLVLIFKRAAR